MSCSEADGRRDRAVLNSKRRRAVGLVGVVAMVVMAAGGCASPPAVEGLVSTAEQVIAEERRLVATDAERASDAVAQQRASLEAGFEADLEQRDSLDVEWVKQGVRVYVDARETLTRHEAELAAAFETRRRNLAVAGEALQRARTLLAEQDGLFDRVPDVRRWLAAQQDD